MWPYVCLCVFAFLTKTLPFLTTCHITNAAQRLGFPIVTSLKGIIVILNNVDHRPRCVCVCLCACAHACVCVCDRACLLELASVLTEE